MNTTLAAIRTTVRDDIVVAAVEGEVDLSNAADVREQLLASVPNTATGLVLDLGATIYLDSQGIQLLLDLTELLEIRGQRLRLVVPDNALIRRVFALTSLSTSLPIDPTVYDAVDRLRAQRG